MKYFITILLIILMLVSCDIENTNKRNVEENAIDTVNNQLLVKDTIHATKVDTTDIKEELTINEFENDADLSKGSFVCIYKTSESRKIIMIYNEKLNEGKLRINGAFYKLGKEVYNENLDRVYSGTKARIVLTGFKEKDNKGGDCVYGIFKKAKILLGNRSREFQNVEIQFCPALEGE